MYITISSATPKRGQPYVFYKNMPYVIPQDPNNTMYLSNLMPGGGGIFGMGGGGGCDFISDKKTLKFGGN